MEFSQKSTRSIHLNWGMSINVRSHQVLSDKLLSTFCEDAEESIL